MPLPRAATAADVPSMVALSAAKRSAYEEVQPMFWRSASDADAKQDAWFRALLARESTIALVADGPSGLDGFAIGLVHSAPPVYDPGGLTLTIDDFCVRTPTLWATVGETLLRGLRARGRERGAIKVVAVCGLHDAPKLALFNSVCFSAASLWLTSPI